MKIIKEVDVKFIWIQFPIDDEEIEEFKDFPKRITNFCELIIDIDEGKIVNWPSGISENVSFCIKDSGTFELFDCDGFKIKATHDGYVPNHLLPGDYGDTLDLDIDENGKILNWYLHPTLEDFEEFRNEENY